MESTNNSPIIDALNMIQRSLYARNINLFRHSCLTANIAYAVVERSGVDFGCLPFQAYIGGILHDIGKMMIPDEILEKRHSLTEREWEVMRRHPAWGQEYVRGTVFEAYEEIIFQHHECQEGNYPLGLSLDQIGKDVRLIALADRMAAFLEDRPYRRRLTNYGLVCRESTNAVSRLFPGEQEASIKAALLHFAVDWFNNSFKEFEVGRLPGLHEGHGITFRHVPCVFSEGKPDGCGVGLCQKQSSATEHKGARLKCL